MKMLCPRSVRIFWCLAQVYNFNIITRYAVMYKRIHNMHNCIHNIKLCMQSCINFRLLHKNVVCLKRIRKFYKVHFHLVIFLETSYARHVNLRATATVVVNQLNDVLSGQGILIGSHQRLMHVKLHRVQNNIQIIRPLKVI